MLMETAKNAVEDNLQDYTAQLKGYVKDSADITNFNTLQTLNAIGIATSNIAEMALREISRSIRNVQMAEKDQNRTFAQPQQCVAFFTGAYELHSIYYLFHEDDVVYIGADKYEISVFDDNAVSLRNVEFPLFGKEYSRAEFEEKPKENPANDHLKVIITESQKTEIQFEKQADGITLSIGFSEHPAFYDRQFNDR